MSITPSLLDQALAELKQDRARIDRAIDGLNALVEMRAEVLPTLSSAAAVSPAPPAERKKGGRRPSSTPPHSDETEGD